MKRGLSKQDAVMEKMIIYQMLPRLWGRKNNTADGEGHADGGLRKRGSLEDNGTGKFSDIDSPTLEYIRWLGCSHVWFTGILRHSTKAGGQGCVPSHPQFVKGEAGSPYAIEDYYDVNPYLADDPDRRMEEFESLVKRTHDAGLKVIMDFVPNHVSRDYGKISRQSRVAAGEPLLGENDDTGVHWSEDNDFFYYPGETLRLPDDAEFTQECRDLEATDFGREYRIVPQWLVEKAFAKASELGLVPAEDNDAGSGTSADGKKAGLTAAARKKAQKEYMAFLHQYRELLVPYQETPARATGNNCYSACPSVNDWYETVKINYCDSHNSTWDKMYHIVRFWASRGVDGFRCDMVELVPVEFFKWMIAKIKEEFPDIIFIAEVYKKELYRKYIREAGFDCLYDKSGLYDTLRAVVEKNTDDNGMPVELWQSATGITRNWQYLGDIQPYMLNFLENHDEQRFASEFFGKDARNSFAALYVSLYFNRAPFMLYFGEEVGEKGMDEEGFSGRDGRTSIFDWWTPQSVSRLHRMIDNGEYKGYSDDSYGIVRNNGTAGRQAAVSRTEDEIAEEVFRRYNNALRFAATDPAINSGTTYDLCYCNFSSEGFDKDRHFVWLRDHEEETLLIAVNFSGREADMKIRIPEHAFEWLGMPFSEELNPERTLRVRVPAMDGVVIRLCPQMDGRH